jgi:hypothetical protein
MYDEAKAKGWTVISRRNDWKQIFPWESQRRLNMAGPCNEPRVFLFLTRVLQR